MEDIYPNTKTASYQGRSRDQSMNNKKKKNNNSSSRGKSKPVAAVQGRGAEEEEEKKKLYVLFEHDHYSEYLYSLYAIDNPSSHHDMVPVTTPIPAVTTTTTVITDNGTTTVSTTTKTLIYGESEPQHRASLDPLLRFRTKDWPRRMACISLDSKLYFLGGHIGGYSPEIEYPKEIYILDLSSRSASVPLLSTFRDEPKEILERGPDMQTGKISPVVSFAADGKIFVLSGKNHCRESNAHLAQFEILTTTAKGKKRWVCGRKPPFSNAYYVGPYAIVNRKVIILATGPADTNYVTSYDLDSETWSVFDTSGWTKQVSFGKFYFSKGSQFIGEALYSIAMPRHTKTKLPAVIALKDHGPDTKEEDTWRVDEKDIFHVVRHRIQSPSPSGVLARVGDRRMCLVHVGAPMAPSGDPDDFSQEECYMCVTLFHVNADGVAEHLDSSHYVMFPDGLPFAVHDAYLI